MERDCFHNHYYECQGSICHFRSMACLCASCCFRCSECHYHRFQPYLFTANPPAGANQDAAAISAAHRVLVTYFPSQQPTLEPQFAASIAAISDTAANISAGITVGKNAAQALIRARANDGLLANVSYTPPVGPGFWLPTPPAFGPP